MKTSQQGIDLIKHYESLNDGDLTMIGLQPKMDPAGIWTEGYGHAMTYNGSFLKGEEIKDIAYSNQQVHNEGEAIGLLAFDLLSREKQLTELGLDLLQNQFDACISFIFNVGFGNFQQSTLLSRIRQSKPDFMIESAFLMWNKGGGVVLPGLTFRRQTEAKLYNDGQLIFYN